MQKDERVTDAVLKIVRSVAGDYLDISDNRNAQMLKIIERQVAALSSAEEKAVETSIDTMKDAAWDLVRKNGWEATARLSLHQVTGLMAELGMQIYRGDVGCGYPDCGCCADAACEDAINQHQDFRSALVDVPAVEEPVAWTSAGNLDGVLNQPKTAWSMWGKPNGLINVPLFAHPPRSSLIQSDEGWQPIETAPKDGTQIIGRTTQEQVFACNWFWDDEDETEGDWLEHGTDVVSPREWLIYPAPSSKGQTDD